MRHLGLVPPSAQHSSDVAGELVVKNIPIYTYIYIWSPHSHHVLPKPTNCNKCATNHPLTLHLSPSARSPAIVSPSHKRWWRSCSWRCPDSGKKQPSLDTTAGIKLAPKTVRKKSKSKWRNKPKPSAAFHHECRRWNIPPWELKLKVVV